MDWPTAKVDSALFADLAKRVTHSKLSIYPDSGHGGIFQHSDTF
jgi:allantoicase